jgi:hypothetical protein
MALEEEYDMEISDEEAEKIRTVQDVVTYIESHKQQERRATRCRRSTRGGGRSEKPIASRPTSAHRLLERTW